MGRKSAARPAPVARFFMGMGAYALSFIAFTALSLVLDAAYGANPSPVLFLATALSSISSVLALPTAWCTAKLAGTVADYRTGRAVEAPRGAMAAVGMLLLAGVASSADGVDALVKGTAAAKGAAAVRANVSGRKAAALVRGYVFAVGLLLCLELYALFLSTGSELFDALCWTVLLTALGGVAVLVVALAVAALRRILADRRSRQGKAAWSLDAETEARMDSGAATVFRRNDAKRRAYVALPRRLLACAALVPVVTTLCLMRIPEPERYAFFDAHPLVHLLVVSPVAVCVASLLPLLGWWIHRSGLSLTQTIVLDGDDLTYSVTNGSGADSTTRTYLIGRIEGYSVGPSCIHVRGSEGTAAGRSFSLHIPRTFDGEERFLSELERRSGATRRS